MKFSEIIGQERTKKILLRAIKTKRIPHAFLFCGMPGTGKKSTAKAFAMLLNCNSPKNNEGCGLCRPCKQLLNGNSPDFITISTEKETVRSAKISIEHIRYLNKKTSFSPIGKYRIVIIDHADNMTDEAANSFLKLLEEPPERNIFILNATESLNLLPTIVSRCQKVQFYPIPRNDIVEWLIKNKGLDTDAANVLSKVCAGSLGIALFLLEKDFLKKREKWISSLIELGSMSREKVFSAAEKYAEEKDEINNMLMGWGTWLRDMIVIKESKDKELLINSDLSYMLEKLSTRYSINDLIDALLLIYSAEQDIYKNRNIGLVIKNMLLRLWKLGSKD